MTRASRWSALPTFRRDQVVVDDTWNVVGLRATGSNEYQVADVLIPDRWVFDPFGPMRRDDPLYRMPSWFVIKHAGIHTALARRAVDEAIAACETKLILPDSVQLIDRPATLEAIARAEAAARSARAFVTDEIARGLGLLRSRGRSDAGVDRSAPPCPRQRIERRCRGGPIDVRPAHNDSNRSRLDLRTPRRRRHRGKHPRCDEPPELGAPRCTTGQTTDRRTDRLHLNRRSRKLADGPTWGAGT